jgi:hypothetical protein
MNSKECSENAVQIPTVGSAAASFALPAGRLLERFSWALPACTCLSASKNSQCQNSECERVGAVRETVPGPVNAAGAYNTDHGKIAINAGRSALTVGSEIRGRFGSGGEGDLGGG